MDILNNLTDFLLYSSIRNYLYARIDYFMEYALSRNLALALTVTVSLLTLWIMIQGFLMVTGRSKESLKDFLFNLGKSYFIILMALGVASSSVFSLHTLTLTIPTGIVSLMYDGDSEGVSQCIDSKAGKTDFTGCKIDRNLALTQVLMGMMNQIDGADDPIIEEKTDRAKLFAGIGTAGPGIVAGTMLMVYHIAMAMFVGFSPFFILCLLFKKTAPLFQKWLYYGLATVFSNAILAVMADISADLMLLVAKGLFFSKGVAVLLTGEAGSGVAQAATQQLGIGLVLSTLLITVPPMAGMWFNGVMGAYYGTNHFAGWHGGAQPAAGSGAGSGAHGSSGIQTDKNTKSVSEKSNLESIGIGNRSHIPNSTTDTVKSDNRAVGGFQAQAPTHSDRFSGLAVRNARPSKGQKHET